MDALAKRARAVVPASPTAFLRGVFAGVGSIPVLDVVDKKVVEWEDDLCGEVSAAEESDISKAGLSFTGSVGNIPFPRPDFFQGELLADAGGDRAPMSLRFCFLVLARPGCACRGELGGGVVCESRDVLWLANLAE